jgi:hypothetical protein
MLVDRVMANIPQMVVHVLLTAVPLVAVSLAGCSKTTDEPPRLAAATQKPISTAVSDQETVAADAILLRWQFTKDTTYRWSVAMTMQMEAPQGDRLVKGGIDLTLDFDVHAEDATAKNAVLQISIVRIRASSDLIVRPRSV